MKNRETKKSATLKLNLKADSGYSSKEEVRISPEQWGDIQLVIAGKLKSNSKECAEK